MGDSRSWIADEEEREEQAEQHRLLEKYKGPVIDSYRQAYVDSFHVATAHFNFNFEYSFREDKYKSDLIQHLKQLDYRIKREQA